MKKKIFIPHKKFISGSLLTLVFVGTLFAILAVASPYLELTTLKFIDGAPDAPNFTDNFIKLLLSLLPGVPVALFLGGVSAFLYTLLESEDKVFLRIWGAVLLLILAVFASQHLG